MTPEEREHVRGLIDQRRRELCRMVPRVHRAVTPYHRRAGSEKVERMREAFRTLRVATQAKARQVAGVDSGTATHAVRALVWEGALQPTGRVVERSPEYALVEALVETQEVV